MSENISFNEEEARIIKDLIESQLKSEKRELALLKQSLKQGLDGSLTSSAIQQTEKFIETMVNILKKLE